MTSKRVVITIVAAILVTASLVSYLFLFPYFAPTMSQQAHPRPVVSPCSSLVHNGQMAPISGIVLYTCGENIPALSIPSPPQLTPAVTPSFVLPQANGSVGPLSVWLVSSGTACSSTITLTSGSTPHLRPGSYDYCLAYSNFPSTGGTIPSFTITWS